MPQSTKGIPVILIVCGVDWCLSWWEELMRRFTNRKKWRRQNWRKYLPSSEKNELRYEQSTPQSTKGIPVILIKWGVDWCLSRWEELMRRQSNRKKWRRLNGKNTYHVTKKPIATWAVNATPIQRSPCDPRLIRRRLMSEGMKRIDEKAYEL